MSETVSEPVHENELLGTETLTPERFDALRQLVVDGNRDGLLTDLQDRHESDIAEIITVLPPDLRRTLIELIGSDLPPEVFAELDENVRDEAVEAVDTDTLVATVHKTLYIRLKPRARPAAA